MDSAADTTLPSDGEGKKKKKKKKSITPEDVEAMDTSLPVNGNGKKSRDENGNGDVKLDESVGLDNSVSEKKKKKKKKNAYPIVHLINQQWTKMQKEPHRRRNPKKKSAA